MTTSRCGCHATMIEENRSRIARKRWQLELQVVYQHLTVIRALYSSLARGKALLLHTLQLPRLIISDGHVNIMRKKPRYERVRA